MIGVHFLIVASVIVLAGTRLARYGDVLGEKTGLGRSWIGVVLLAATTSLPELAAGFGATALTPLPDLAIGNVLGACMFNLLILSIMDALNPEPIGARAHQGHALSIGFGLLLVGIAGIGLAADAGLPHLGWVGLYSPVLIGTYLVAVRVIFTHERHRRTREQLEVAEELHYEGISLNAAALRYAGAGALVVAAAIWLPRLGAEVARQTGLGDAFVGSVFMAVTTSLPEIVVSVAAVRIGAIDLGIGNVLGSIMFNLFILGLDDVFYREAPLLGAADPSHAVTLLAIVCMSALFLVGLTCRVMTKRFVVTWDTGSMALVYAAAVGLVYVLRT
jgi:cation:H+ antiporter